MDDTQREIVEFLRDPASYPAASGPVEVMETHASLVFLAGGYAYKLKRAAKYTYLDFSTPALRLAACTAELKLNRRTAPQLYLEVRAISRGADGRLTWRRGRRDQIGEALDFVVVMRRFDQRDLLDDVARRGELTRPLLQALTAHIAVFHDGAEKCPERGGGTAMAAVARDNIAVLRGCRSLGVEATRIDAIAAVLNAEIGRVGGLLDERRDAGKVRRVHGDLHLRNVCLVDGSPLLFDCIEFSEDIASIDVLYDLAFLLMDLDHRGQRDFANLVLNRYLDLTGEEAGLAALPLFVALRALIRAHVTATMAEHGWGGGEPAMAVADARAYFAEAEAALAPRALDPPRLIAVGGLSGTGKSTLAAALAPALGRPHGARVLRSDVLRKLMLGSEPESALPPEAYSSDITERVYRELGARARTVLRAGCTAIIDAVALRPEEREAFAAVAAAAGVPFTGLWLEAPVDRMIARVSGRTGDASDASPDVVQQQAAHDPGLLDWVRIDAAGAPQDALAAARRVLLH